MSDSQIQEWLCELLNGETDVYGYCKLTICLQREYDLVIYKKKVYRLLDEMEMLQPQRRKRLKHPRKLANKREIKASNVLWEMDIKYGYITGEQRFFYLLCVIDVLDREVIDFHMGLSCEGKHAAGLIQRTLWQRQLFETKERPVIRTDNGPQFISHVFEEACAGYDVTHERIPPKTPNKNAHIESFHSLLEAECLQRYEFSNYQEANEIVTNYIHFYNERRMHGSLYDLAPKQFRQSVTMQQVQAKTVKV
ncbi:IS3 family transposase [Paenibacillus sp. LHD-38]|uniref:IS3 family transposase n=1 Tax=Paenibacillus sp. LHD-38 TaxID=3072143 RepID=UPI002810407D|nr:IS3 family transposase [Paenibacillus sp. LHD-38]MDQ8738618.1 IS3 family transposase [Paenibacillus sp. LHD-38]